MNKADFLQKTRWIPTLFTENKVDSDTFYRKQGGFRHFLQKTRWIPTLFTENKADSDTFYRKQGGFWFPGGLSVFVGSIAHSLGQE
jgi:hypothetical protein